MKKMTMMKTNKIQSLRDQIMMTRNPILITTDQKLMPRNPILMTTMMIVITAYAYKQDPNTILWVACCGWHMARGIRNLALLDYGNGRLGHRHPPRCLRYQHASRDAAPRACERHWRPIPVRVNLMCIRDFQSKTDEARKRESLFT